MEVNGGSQQAGLLPFDPGKPTTGMYPVMSKVLAK
jgi:hypothetical protein